LFGEQVDCGTCGRNNIEHNAALAVRPMQDKYLLSGITRQASKTQKVLTITKNNIEQLLQSTNMPGGPLGKMDRLLLYIAHEGQSADEFIPLDRYKDWPLVFAKNSKEFVYLSENLVKQGLLEQPVFMSEKEEYRLTPAGWGKAAELRRTERDSSQAFVAMWFDSTLDAVYEDGFKPALEKTGFKPIRIDLVPHDEYIPLRILAEIRRSGLLVADLTENRGGVYFEAGFAMGLGTRVIWTCRKDAMNDVHFDTRQFPHILWEQPSDLKEKLINRIEATFPDRAGRAST